MVFRYRGFHMLATEPHVRPVMVRVFDPMRPAAEEFDAAVGRACAYVDGLCADGPIHCSR